MDFSLISIGEVIVPENRFRREFDEAKIIALAEGITTTGLLQLPILREGNLLVAGERRLRAIQYLYLRGKTFSYHGQPVPEDMFPFAPFESLDEESALEAELQENVLRVDLTWQEHSKAVAELDELRRRKNPDWTHADTAKELDRTNVTKAVNHELILAKNLDRPAVRNAKTKAEALKILNKEMERDFETELRRRQPERKSPHILWNLSAKEAMGKLNTGSIACIVSDPPWGKGADKFGLADSYGQLAHKYKDDWASAVEHYTLLAVEGFRVCLDQAHLYVLCEISLWHLLVPTFADAGWDVWPRPFIWSKGRGSLPKPDLGPSYDYEAILFANKGMRATAGLFSDVIDVPAVVEKKHAAEKPVGLYTNLLHRTVLPGEFVLDPFCGAGPIFEAAKELGVLAIGSDIDVDAFNLAKTKL